MNNKWPKSLPHPISWLRAIVLFRGYDLIISATLPEAENLNEVITLIIFAWFCQLPLFTIYHYLLTETAEWVETWRPEFQQPHEKGAWQHWREGIKAILVMFFTAVITTTIASIFLPRPVLRQFMQSPLNLISVIAIAAYLYHWEIARKIKSLVRFCWPLINSYLKTQILLYVPLIACLPILVIALIIGSIISVFSLPNIILALGVFVVVTTWLLSILTVFAAIHYYGTHWGNWVASWWPESFPGYQHFQQKKNQTHNPSVNQSFVHHQTSWKLAAHDLTTVFYTNVLSIITSTPIYATIFNESNIETRKSLSVGLYLIWTTIAIILWHFWGRNRAVKIRASSANYKKAQGKSPTKKAKQPKKTKNTTPPDPIEVELNQLSAEFGITLMRPVRKTPNPEQVLWQVFRSGQAEGPYTREQLWLAQRITARSNVRRVGETDWVRAGEIPELADFLTSKP